MLSSVGNGIPSCGEGHNDAGQATRPRHRAQQDADEKVKRSRKIGRPRRSQLGVWSDVLKVVHSQSRRPASPSQSVEGQEE